MALDVAPIKAYPDDPKALRGEDEVR